MAEEAAQGSFQGEEAEKVATEAWGEDFEHEAEDEEPLGVLNGSTYVLGNFYAWPPSTVEESGLVWNQTAGKLSFILELTGDYKQHAEELQVEGSCYGIRVFITEGKKKQLIPEIKERFWDQVLRSSISWTVQPGSIMDPPSEGLFLTMKLHKLKHQAWPELWHASSRLFNRTPFNWNERQESLTTSRDQAYVKVLADQGEVTPTLPENFNTHDLSLGYEEIDDTETELFVYVHLDRQQLDLLMETGPLEDFLSAEVEESTFRISVRSGTHATLLMEAHLQGRCIPEATAWELVENKKCGIPGMIGWNPALMLVFVKSQDEHRLWSPVFTSIRHLSERRMREAQEAAKKADAAPGTSSKPRHGPKISRHAVVRKFRSLVHEDGVKPREAVEQALAHVREAAKRGDSWALFSNEN